MELITKQSKCMGCSLCQNMCFQNAISMRLDSDGFLIPHINTELCLDCGACKNACPAYGVFCNKETYTQQFLIGSSPNREIVNKSSSGGVFFELAKYIIEYHKGIVYGAAFDKDFSVRHIRAEILEDVEPMHCSKYNQSDLSNVYRSIKNDLLNGKYVLFSGTPCQVYALKCFLKKKYDKLITVDVLCFGVMSTKFLEDYISFVMGGQNCQYSNMKVNFRSKKIAEWGDAFTIEKNGKVIYSEKFHGSKEGIGYVYCNRLIMRKSCNDCGFHSLYRHSDITIGDYPSNNVSNSLFNNSSIIVNTKSGEQLINCININFKRMSLTETKTFGERVLSKPVENIEYDSFLRYYRKHGIDRKLYEKMKVHNISMKTRISSKLKKIFMNLEK